MPIRDRTVIPGKDSEDVHLNRLVAPCFSHEGLQLTTFIWRR